MKNARGRLAVHANGFVSSVRTLLSLPPPEVLPEPDEETLRRWQAEAALGAVQGRRLDKSQREHIRSLKISGTEHALREGMRKEGVALSDRYGPGDIYTRKFKFNNIEVISGYRRLENLDLSKSLVSDISKLSSLRRLRHLNVSHTEVSSLAPLSRIRSLISLDVSDTKIEDIDDLLGLERSLKDLKLANCNISDIEVLSKFSSLESLDLSNTNILDLKPLSHCKNLQILHVRGTKITSLWPLVSLSNLRRLTITGTRVTTLKWLSNLKHLEFVDARPDKGVGPYIKDFEPVSHVRRVWGRDKIDFIDESSV